MNYIEEISFTSNEFQTNYLNNLPAIRTIIEGAPLPLTKPVTFFVGENGTGKSTLLEGLAVAYGFNPEGGTLNFNFKTRETHSELHDFMYLKRPLGHKARDGFFLRAESFYNMASYIDDIDVSKNYGGTSLHHQSHGESFLNVISHRFSGDGLYILDEPEAALSPMRLMTLMVILDELVKSGSQVIIATHSPILMAFPNAEILEFSENGIASIHLEETEHFQVTKNFMMDPKRMIRYLLPEEDHS